MCFALTEAFTGSSPWTRRTCRFPRPRTCRAADSKVLYSSLRGGPTLIGLRAPSQAFGSGPRRALRRRQRPEDMAMSLSGRGAVQSSTALIRALKDRPSHQSRYNGCHSSDLCQLQYKQRKLSCKNPGSRLPKSSIGAPQQPGFRAMGRKDLGFCRS